MKAVIASSDVQLTIALQSVLADFDIRHIDTADQVLLEAHLFEPTIVIVHANLRGSLGAAEVAGLLSRRADLRQTWLLAIAPLEMHTAFYEAGVSEIEAEPFNPERFKLRLELGLRAKQTQQALLQRIDIAEQKYTHLLEEEKLRDRLTHMLVHDLKNPITAIMGAVDFIRPDAARLMPRQQSDLIEMAFEESQRLLHLASNILEVRKMRDGKLKLEPRAMNAKDLQNIIEGAVMDVGFSTQDRKLRARVPESLPLFSADEDILRRVLTNLVSNATKHTQSQGKIQLTARAVGEMIEVAVHDDGEGIPQEDLERIFRDFEGSRLTNSTRYDTGMGLAFCKLAVEQHGGAIWVKSKRGEGSSFFFTLPQEVPDYIDDEVELVDG